MISILLLPVLSAKADNTSLYMEADVTQLNLNQEVEVSIRINTGDQMVDTVEAYLAYNVNHLEFISISPAGSAFPTALGPQTGAAGSVQIVRGAFDSVSGQVVDVNGDVLVAKVKFKSLISEGDTAIFFTPSSNATSNGNYVNPTISGQYLQFGPNEPLEEIPPEEPPTNQSVGSENTSTPGGNNTSTTPPNGSNNVTSSGSTTNNDSITTPALDTKSPSTTTADADKSITTASDFPMNGFFLVIAQYLSS